MKYIKQHKILILNDEDFIRKGNISYIKNSTFAKTKFYVKKLFMESYIVLYLKTKKEFKIVKNRFPLTTTHKMLYFQGII